MAPDIAVAVGAIRELLRLIRADKAFDDATIVAKELEDRHNFSPHQSLLGAPGFMFGPDRIGKASVFTNRQALCLRDNPESAAECHRTR